MGENYYKVVLKMKRDHMKYSYYCTPVPNLFHLFFLFLFFEAKQLLETGRLIL